MKLQTLILTFSLLFLASACSQTIPPGEVGYQAPGSPTSNLGPTPTPSPTTGTGGGTGTGTGGGTGGTGTGGGGTSPTIVGNFIFLSSPQSFSVATCSPPIIFKSVDVKTNVTLPVTSNLSVSLSGPVNFFSDPLCLLPVTSITISTGNSTGSFYIKTNVTQSASLTIQSSTYNQANQVETISAGVATSLTITTQPGSSGAIGKALTRQPVLKITDMYGNAITSASGSVTAAPYTDSACTIAASGALLGGSANLISGIATFTTASYNASGGIYLLFTYGNSGLTACSQLITLYAPMVASPTSFKIDSVLEYNLVPLVSGGQPPYSYSLTSSISSLVSPSSGDYISGNNTNPFTEIDVITVRDQSGQSVIIDGIVYPNLSASVAKSIVVGNTTDQINVTGGVPPYTYTITSGAGSVSPSGLYTAPATATSTTISIQDAGGGSPVTVTLTVNDALSVTPTTATLLFDFDTQLTATGGIPPYVYTIQSGGGQIDETGDYTAPSTIGIANIQISDSDSPPNLVFSVITISSGPATSLVINNQPGDGKSGFTLTTLPTLSTQNDNDNVDNGFNQAVTVAVYDSNCLNPISGSSVQISPAQFVNGNLNPTSLIVNAAAGNYTLNFTAGGLSVCSDSFNLAAVPSKIVSFDNSNCYINNQTIKCWGSNSGGQLSFNPTISSTSYTPVTIPGLTSNVSDVEFTATSACALDSGVFKCWGSNTYGQLATSTTTTADTYSPYTVASISGTVTAFAGSQKSFCAVVDGSTECWGDDTNHQLGRGIPSGSGIGACSAVTSLTTCVKLDGCDTQSDICSQINDPTSCTANGCSWDGDNCTLAGSTTGQGGQIPPIGACSAISNLSTCVELTGCDTQSDTCSSISDPGSCSNSGCSWDGNNLVCNISGADACVGTSTDHCEDFSSQSLCTTIPSCNWSNNSCTTTAGVSAAPTTNTDSCVGTSTDTCDSISDSTDCLTVPSCGWSGNACYNKSANYNGQNTYVPTSVFSHDFGVTQLSGTNGNTNTFCAINSGQIYCWGNNTNDQCGNNNALDDIPTLAGSFTSASLVSVGGLHACALQSNSVSCWGYDGDGQLGNGAFSAVASPNIQKITSLTGVSKVSSGGAFTCALDTSGNVWCWGRGAEGQLGLGNDFTSVNTPTKVSSLSNVLDISVGKNHSCAEMSDKSIRCWGDNEFGQLGTFSQKNYDTTKVISNLGGGITNYDMSPTAVCSLSGSTLSCVGQNSQQIISSTKNVVDVYSSAQSISSFNSISGITKLSLGSGGGICAINSAGAAYCVGNRENGTSGDGGAIPATGSLSYNSTPTPVIGWTSSVSDISFGLNQSCGIQSGGAYCWGVNTNGALGTGDASDSTTSSNPLAVSTLSSGVTSIKTTSANAACAIQSGAVFCWGAGASQLLGSGTNQDQRTPGQVLNLSTVTEIEASAHRVCANQGGTIYCWGTDYLGNGTSGSSLNPQIVSIITSATSIGVGLEHTCAVQGGQVYCWGSNSSGQLGQSKLSTTTSLTPMLVPGITTAVTVKASGNSTCALLSSGSLSCWGDNSYGQLGDGSTLKLDTPVVIPGI